MINDRCFRPMVSAVAVLVLVLAPPARSETTVATAVAPGAPEAFLRVPDPCPSFSWVPGGPGGGETLVVYRIGEGETELAASDEVLAVDLPAGAAAWTPSAERCLSPGRYAWSVGSKRTGWSPVMLFSIPEIPSRAELLREIRRLEALLAEDEATVAEGRRPEAPGSGADDDRRGQTAPGPAPRSVEGTPVVAVRGEVADPSGETYGLSGVVGSPDGAGVRAENTSGSGPDLVLVGSDSTAELSEGGLLRTSDGDVAFEVGNPGTGSMTLRVDGVDVVTTATDQDTQYEAGNEIVIDGTTIHVDEGTGSGLDADLLDGMDSTDFLTVGTESWVDEAGDTMTGPLVVDVPSGFALQTGSGDPIDVGGGVYENGTRLLEGGGGSNLAVGLGSLLGNTTGIGNTAVGDSALASNTEGLANTGVGASALLFNQTARDQTAVGFEALRQSVADWNTAVGSLALRNTISGVSNTAVGAFALESNIEGEENTGIGFEALRQSTAGKNTAVGSEALRDSTTGFFNTAVGHSALASNLDGYLNTAVGGLALQRNESGYGNVAVGIGSLSVTTSSSGNVAVGYGTFSQLSSGTNNIAIGEHAGTSVLQGSNNIFVGNYGSETSNDTIRIGKGTHAATYIGGIEGVPVSGSAVYIDSNGRLGTFSSSRRFKEGIRPVGDVSRRLLELRPVSFRYTEEALGRAEPPREFGLLAEEVAEVLPELVVFDEEGRPQGVRYNLLSSLLLAELQRTDERLAAVEARLEEGRCRDAGRREGSQSR